MLWKEDFTVIKALHERGVYQKDIALQLGVHSKMISRALKRQSAPPQPARATESAPHGAKTLTQLSQLSQLTQFGPVDRSSPEKTDHDHAAAGTVQDLAQSLRDNLHRQPVADTPAVSHCGGHKCPVVGV
jgi:hypothetical protein